MFAKELNCLEELWKKDDLAGCVSSKRSVVEMGRICSRSIAMAGSGFKGAIVTLMNCGSNFFYA
jgi:hypothetical protein